MLVPSFCVRVCECVLFCVFIIFYDLKKSNIFKIQIHLNRSPVKLIVTRNSVTSRVVIVKPTKQRKPLYLCFFKRKIKERSVEKSLSFEERKNIPLHLKGKAKELKSKRGLLLLLN